MSNTKYKLASASYPLPELYKVSLHFEQKIDKSFLVFSCGGYEMSS